MTISSGLAGVGKTHLAVNLALEMVRRGRQAAVFNQTSSRSSIDALLDLPQTAILQRRSTDHGDALVRRGYQGIDILSSGIALSQWDSAPLPAVKKIIADMNVKGGHDDFLVDTSGMDPRTQLACCRASSLVIMVVTPDSRSLPETFALLRILQLNDFDGESCLLINQVDDPADADELYLEFSTKLDECLGIDVPLLGVLANDVHVARAERSRQAFSSLFPNAEVSGQIVAIADAIDVAIPRASAERHDLTAYWDSFREMLAAPVALTGGALLELPGDAEAAAGMPPQPCRESGAEVKLLQLDSSFFTFSDALDRLPGLLQATADDVSKLHGLLEEADQDRQEDVHPSQDSSSLLSFAVCLIRDIERLVAPVQKLQLQVNESRVRGDDADWLQAGCYLKYIFRFPDQQDVLLRIKSVLASSSGFQQESGQNGETVWENVVIDHNGCMNVVHTPDDNIRIQVWLPLRKQPEAHRGNQEQGLASSRVMH
jgi:flagellar biosynthesis protein FlhG